MTNNFVIKLRLTENGLNQTWLIMQLSKKGVNVSKSELSSCLSGTRQGPKVSLILAECEKILDNYERKMSDE